MFSEKRCIDPPVKLHHSRLSSVRTVASNSARWHIAARRMPPVRRKLPGEDGAETKPTAIPRVECARIRHYAIVSQAIWDGCKFDRKFSVTYAVDVRAAAGRRDVRKSLTTAAAAATTKMGKLTRSLTLNSMANVQRLMQVLRKAFRDAVYYLSAALRCPSRARSQSLSEAGSDVKAWTVEAARTVWSHRTRWSFD
ncbi:hypothetical protein BV20DRAFT_523370 [Pilatotrama ljubarskyi]|nr:hypothetical protein BV20DRAFT_523370 [Pilatotrama ljubarskyi]